MTRGGQLLTDLLMVRTGDKAEFVNFGDEDISVNGSNTNLLEEAINNGVHRSRREEIDLTYLDKFVSVLPASTTTQELEVNTKDNDLMLFTVSYTHLTLQTILLV